MEEKLQVPKDAQYYLNASGAHLEWGVSIQRPNYFSASHPHPQKQLLPPQIVNHPSVINPSSQARVARPMVPHPLPRGPS